jgi:lipoic acid synthetase
MRIPAWIIDGLREREKSKPLLHLLKEKHLATVCKEAQCPNISTCFAKGTATFLIMGSVCTRNCAFCAIDSGKPDHLDSDEPRRVAEMVGELGIKHAVITSVTRDDLRDGGAQHFIETIRAIRAGNAGVTIEVLIPDLNGSETSLDAIIREAPEVINHNIETVKPLYVSVRPGAEYDRSLALLARVSGQQNGIAAKSGMMVGLGETEAQVYEAMDDLIDARVGMLTIGQYLRPSRKHHDVKRYVTPDEFERYKTVGMEKGFLAVASGPFVRSSFHAQELYEQAKSKI